MLLPVRAVPHLQHLKIINQYDIIILYSFAKDGVISLILIPERFHAMRSCAGTYYLIVLEDTKLEKIVASGTLIVEQKFIHEAAVVCTT